MKWATRNGRSPPFSADSRNLGTPLESYIHFTFRGALRRPNYSVDRKLFHHYALCNAVMISRPDVADNVDRVRRLCILVRLFEN